MASTDDSFSGRVQKAFGSLGPTASSPWTLNGNAVERRRWKLDHKDTSARDETPCSSSFDDFLRKGAEWEIRSSIGLDSTLDNEEEEDEFDKVAAGREKPGERLYMGEVNDRGPYLNVHNVLPKSLCDAARDPRANLHAARIRLKEDDAEAQNLNFPHPQSHAEIKESRAAAGQLKSILKRKEKDSSTDFKAQKRVRFDPAFKIDSNEASENFEYSSSSTPSIVSTDSDDGSQLAQNVYRVPDYLLNPSKYTRYSFDSSSEHTEESNIKACIDLLKVVKSSKTEEPGPELENASGNHPKSVIFIPKKKASDVNSSGEIKENKDDVGRRFLPVGIAAGESRESEVSPFDEIEPETNATDHSAPVKKPGRNYRMQSTADSY